MVLWQPSMVEHWSPLRLFWYPSSCINSVFPKKTSTRLSVSLHVGSEWSPTGLKKIFPEAYSLFIRVVSTEVFHCHSNTVELQKALQKPPQPELTSIINLSGTLAPYVQKDRQSSPLCSDFALISDQRVGKILRSKSWHCSGFWRVMVLVGKK